jgi:Ni/Co efflux regulator RcnB
MVTPYRPKPPRNRVAISTRDLARRMRKRLNKTTEGIEVAVAKVKNNAEIATKELEVKRTRWKRARMASPAFRGGGYKVREARRFNEMAKRNQSYQHS